MIDFDRRYTFVDARICCHTVDGRNPKQPPGMYKSLQKMGEPTNLNRLAGCLPSTACFCISFPFIRFVWKFFGSLHRCPKVRRVPDGVDKAEYAGRLKHGLGTLRIVVFSKLGGASQFWENWKFR